MSPACWDTPRRHATAAHTGALRNKRLQQLTPSTATSSSSISSRLSRVRNETSGNHTRILNRLVSTLEENGVPGPQFFRLQKEFSAPLGEGGQGNVRGINEDAAKRYKKANKNVLAKWPVELIAIKQYQQKTAGRKTQGPNRYDLSSRFRAAECEVLALSPNLFRGHPNIVQLMGWGLCLDTVESPNSPCCEFLQVPVLVLERGEMNLLQFLDRIMPRGTRSVDVGIEQGLASTSPYDLNRESGTEKLASSFNLMSRWLGFKKDPYDTVRLLTIDIGRGLQSLHDHGFTHGDLKPENVLLFRRNINEWQAKLCDFGCAHGKDEGMIKINGVFQPAPQTKERYLGTPGWLPPPEEEQLEHDHEGLRRCDLFVYGLLLWSCFLLRGDPPPENPSLEDALADLETLTGKWWIPGNHNWLAGRIEEALTITMTVPHGRHPRPWEFLCTRRERAVESKRVARERERSSSKPLSTPTRHNSSSSDSRTKSDDKHPLSPLIKARYKELDWWLVKTNSDASTASEASPTAISRSQSMSDHPVVPEAVLITIENVDVQSTNAIDSTDIVFAPNGSSQDSPKEPQAVVIELPEPEPSPLSEYPGSIAGKIHDVTADAFKVSITVQEESVEHEGEEDEEVEEGNGPARSKPMTTDDNYLGTNLFESESRQRDAEILPHQMMEAVESMARGTSGRETLYYYARFRSRIKLEWWQAASTKANILDGALKLGPIVDINTLAWLCKGPVGKYEAQHLTAHYGTWKTILDSGDLNESERLDRLLLLLQFGARVEQRLISRHGSVLTTSILAAYINNCRPAVVPTVIAEICKRFVEVEHNGSILTSTRMYMRSRDNSYRVGNAAAVMPTLKRDLQEDGNMEAITQYWKHGLIRSNISNLDPPSQSRETTTLLTPPFGWRILKTAFKAKETELYEEEFTQSITLTKPRISLIKLRQIEIGYLNDKRLKCHLDLAWGTSLGSSTDIQLFAKEITNRFPCYEESWFDREWMTEPSQKDVLGRLKEPWKLPTFAIRVQLPQIDFLGWFLWGAGNLLKIVGSLIVLGLVVGLIALVFPIFVYTLLFALFFGIFGAPSPQKGAGAIVVLLAKIAALWLWLKIVDWTCPGAGPTWGEWGFEWPHGKENCTTCWWILWTRWNCR